VRRWYGAELIIFVGRRVALKKSVKNANRANYLQKLTIAGYKSIVKPTMIEFGALTVLAGVNSGGKSSLIQPLLLLKQTIEATHDPGPLKIDGPNVRFSELQQFFSMPSVLRPRSLSFNLGFLRRAESFEFKASGRTLNLSNNTISIDGKTITLSGGTIAFEQLVQLAPPSVQSYADEDLGPEYKALQFQIAQSRFIFSPKIDASKKKQFWHLGIVEWRRLFSHIDFYDTRMTSDWVRNLTHVPGLRGVPARGYAVSGVGDSFPGRFEDYTASVIKRWQDDGDARVGAVGAALEALGLTWKVSAENIDAATVDIKIGRLPKSAQGGAKDLVSIADVGFGVSQVMPVVVALFAAQPGQAVYIEQPEIHLHPRAQMALAGLLVDAANRDVQVIVETHSALLLTSLQTLIAQQKIAAADVKLHWVSRDASGSSVVTTAELDADGAYGDWPVDFDETADAATTNYLNATVFKATSAKAAIK